MLSLTLLGQPTSLFPPPSLLAPPSSLAPRLPHPPNQRALELLTANKSPPGPQTKTKIPEWDPTLYSYIMALSLSAAIGQVKFQPCFAAHSSREPSLECCQL